MLRVVIRETHPDAEAVQIQLLREASVARRFALLCSLTHTTIMHAKRAIACAHPDLGARDRDLRFVELHYGKDVAQRLRRFLEARLQ